MSANTNYFIWRFFGILLYPLYALFCHLRFRKRAYQLTCLVNDLANTYDTNRRGQIAHQILKLVYRDTGDTDTRCTFDFAAVSYLTTHAPWLAIRCNLEERKVVLATRQGDLVLCEKFQYLYQPDFFYVDKCFKDVNDRIREANKELRVAAEVNRKIMALLIYFIMLNITRRP
ncbi:hypothetical protein [Erwinia phage vB_Ea277G]|nr:hypothetical protein [Erwinia phage vB_Ea277G]